MEDENVLLREEEIQKLTNTMTTTNTSKSYVDSSINLNTLGNVGLGTTTPNQTLNIIHGTGSYNYAIDRYDVLTNDERINAILKSVNSLTDSVNTLKATARELISEMKVEKHERRTLGKNSE